MNDCTICKQQHMYDGCLCCSCRDSDIVQLQTKLDKCYSVGVDLENEIIGLVGENRELQAENKVLKKRYSINSFQRELAVQCIDFVKNSPKGYGSIPLGYNLAEDIGIISQAEQALKEGK